MQYHDLTNLVSRHTAVLHSSSTISVSNMTREAEENSDSLTDRAVLANAFASGMDDDVHLQGNEYNLLVTCLSGKLPLTT